MSQESRQVPLQDILKFTKDAEGRYHADFPPSIAYGAVVLGGAIVAVAAKAAADVVSHSENPASRQLTDVVHYSLNFVRPVFCQPKEAVFILKVVNTAKTSIALHIEVQQGEKACIFGYMIMSELSTPREWNSREKWELSPPPPSPPSLDSLVGDPYWALVHVTGSEPSIPNRAQSYVDRWIPKCRDSISIVDQWASPGWSDASSPTGAVWTDDSVHLLLDSALSPIYDLIDSDDIIPFYKRVLEGAESHAEARRQGKSHEFVPAGLGKESNVRLILTTTNITTEIKQRLPAEGVKWLFLRTTTKMLRNNRCDYVIDLLDVQGNIIAIAQHAMQVISFADKFERKQPKL